jgi:hypothetical protein
MLEFYFVSMMVLLILASLLIVFTYLCVVIFILGVARIFHVHHVDKDAF